MKYKIFLLFLFLTLIPLSAKAAEPYQDLITQDIEISPASPSVNQDTRIRIKIKNNGTYNLYTNKGLNNYSFSFPGFSVESTITPNPSISAPIAAGGIFYYTFYGKFTSVGAKTLSFEVDTLNELIESSVTNNILTKNATIIASNSLDLKIDSIEISPSEPVIYQPAKVTVKLKNSGTGSLVKSDGLTFDDINYSLGSFQETTKYYSVLPTVDNPLDQNEYITYTFEGQFTNAGAYNFVFTFDKYSKISESDKTNNSTTTAKTIYSDYTARDDFDISNFRYDSISSSSIAFYWETSQEASGKIGYHKDMAGADIESAEGGSATKTSHGMSIGGLLSNTNYYFRAISTNDTVTKGTSYFLVKTPENDNLLNLVEPSAVINQINKTARINWQTNLQSTSNVYYKRDGATAFSQAGSDTATTSHSLELTGLKTGNYSYYTVSRSAVKTYATSSTKTFLIAETAASATTTLPASTTASTATTATNTTAAQSTVKLAPITINNYTLYQRLKGKIILKVESKGEAYYISPLKQEMYYLGKPDDAFQIVRQLGIGITNANLTKIQNSDAVRTANIDLTFSKKQAGRIFLQVESRGEAWYIYPLDYKKYYMNSPVNAFSIMRTLGLGISNKDFSSL
jgi:hypothetical protein